MPSPLSDRGILPAALQAGWTDAPNPYDQRTPGWRYPVFGWDGSPVAGVARWKNADSQGQPKYVWWPKGAERPALYALPGLVDAVAAADGELHMVSGEPDLLTLVMVGLPNATCAFGEQNIANLDAWIERLGVRRLIYWRDPDDAGLSAALKVRDLLRGSPVAFACRLLPGDTDLNALWQACRFDTATFLAALASSTIEALPEPQPSVAPNHERSGARDAYEAWCETVEQAALAAWHFGAPDGQQFSRRMIRCPFHDDSDPSAHWNYRTHGLKCFACDQEYNTHAIADTLGVESYADYKARHAPARTSAQNRQKPTGPQLITRAEALERAHNRLFGIDLPDAEPYLAPYTPLRQFGGLAKLWEPGQMGLIISGGGMGKSAFVERCIDNLNVAGMDAIMWGPEWTAERLQNRAITRYGGPLMERQMEQEAYEFSRQRHDEPETVPLTADERRLAKKLFEEIQGWPGRTYYVPNTVTHLGRALKMAASDVAYYRDQDRRVALAVFDYAQLAVKSNDWTQLEMMLASVQEWSIKTNVFSLVVSQVNKGEADRLRETGKLFTADSAQLISDQRAKLILSLNPVYVDGARLEKAHIVLLKNNIGAVPAKILVQTALHRHDWTDHVLEGIEGHGPPPDQAPIELDWYHQ